MKRSFSQTFEDKNSENTTGFIFKKLKIREQDNEGNSDQVLCEFIKQWIIESADCLPRTADSLKALVEQFSQSYVAYLDVGVIYIHLLFNNIISRQGEMIYFTTENFPSFDQIKVLVLQESVCDSVSSDFKTCFESIYSWILNLKKNCSSLNYDDFYQKLTEYCSIKRKSSTNIFYKLLNLGYFSILNDGSVNYEVEEQFKPYSSAHTGTVNIQPLSTISQMDVCC